MKQEYNNSLNNQVENAVLALHAGKLVAFPTETVYGLGANANNLNAIKKVFAAKDRPIDHPLIVHVADYSELTQWAKDIPKSAKILSQHFWPGPLTMVLPKKDEVHDIITGGQSTIALRIPQHPLTLEMLRQFKGGMVGPSANTHCRISPTSAAHVQADLGDKVDVILDGGNCAVGIESTIIAFKNDMPYILRQGNITANDISRALGTNIPSPATLPSSIKTPGNLKLHYAPKKPLLLLNNDELALALSSNKYGTNVTVISLQPIPVNFDGSLWLEMPTTAIMYAKKLYSTLHTADQSNTDLILVESPPITENWGAIIDRLTKSSHAIVDPLERIDNSVFLDHT